MATSNPDYLSDSAFGAKSYEEPRRQRGCLFYGCLISSGLVLLLVIAMGIFSYMAYRSLVRFVEENTASTPREIPRVELPDAARRTLKERIESFKKAKDAGEATEPLILTADEVNTLIEEDPRWKGQVYLAIDGETVRGKLSLSLDKLSEVLEKIGFSMLRGRYFNGEVELKGGLENGILNIIVNSLEVNGRPLPQEVIDSLKNSTVEFSKDPKVAEEVQKIESVEIKDGKIIIRGRTRKKEPERGASPPQHNLPDDVFVPADASLRLDGRGPR